MISPDNKFLRKDKLPTLWCAGCGNGILMGAIMRAMEACDFAVENTVVVTGIGCWGKADDYFSTHAFHGTHGRAIPIATGIKFARPSLNVVAMVGDGDGATIGGNHLIHAARRNTDITVIMSNNFNYGMTGGQYSGSTPRDSITSTSPYGHVEDEFNISALVKESGAGYVARETVAKQKQLEKYIKNAFDRGEGFRFIEALSTCPTQYGKNNKLGDVSERLNDLAENRVDIDNIKELDSEQLQNEFVVGEYADEKVESYLQRYEKLQQELSPERSE